MVASGSTNLFASVSAGVCALWGPSHGGANMAVIKMLEEIYDAGDDGSNLSKPQEGYGQAHGFWSRLQKL